MSDYKDKEKIPITACEWIDESIKRTEETAISYRKIIEAVEQRKIREAEVPEAIFLFGPSDDAESALRIIRRIDAQARGHIDLLGMVKRDLKCE